MNGQQPITYQQVVEKIVAYITSNCKNIDALNIPTASKNGYSKSSTAGDTFKTTVKLTLSNNVSTVSSGTVSSDMNSFLSSILKMSASDLNSYISDINYFAFMHDMLVFCTTKIALLISNDPVFGGAPTELKSLVYIASNKDYQNILTLNRDAIDIPTSFTYKASEIDKYIQSLFTVEGLTKYKVVSNKYTYSISYT